MNYTCPVCGYANLNYPPNRFTICPSCGTEFGNDDLDISHAELTQKWVRSGMRWWSANVPIPQGWNPVEQIKHILETTEAHRELTLDGLYIPVLVTNQTQPRSTTPNSSISTTKLLPPRIGSSSSNSRAPIFFIPA